MRVAPAALAHAAVRARRASSAVRATRVALLLVALATAVALVVPAAASADGDPPSDFLLSQDTFVPLQHPPTTAATRALEAAVHRSRGGTLDLKVAVVGSQVDLGTVGQLWQHPDQYAPFLRKEIRFTFTGTLLVVMPAGMATAGPHADAVLAVAERATTPKAGDTPDQLTARATTAAAAIARKYPGSTKRGSGGVHRNWTGIVALVVAVAAGLLLAILLGAVIARVSRRRRDATPPAADDD